MYHRSQLVDHNIIDVCVADGCGDVNAAPAAL
jgi:hypothetical protein